MSKPAPEPEPGDTYKHDLGIVEVVGVWDSEVVVSLVDRADHETTVAREQFNREFERVA